MNLLFVCTGNICRSPIAEGLAPVKGSALGLTIHAKSAGTLGLQNRNADPKSVKVCKEIGVDIVQHRSQGLSNELVDWATYILVMERRHARHVRQHFPNAGNKILELGSFGGMAEVPDPIGGWIFKFRKCRKQIDRCLTSFLTQIQQRQRR